MGLVWLVIFKAFRLLPNMITPFSPEMKLIMNPIEELYNQVKNLPIREIPEADSDSTELIRKFALDVLLAEASRSMDWLVITTDESGESRYPCYYADSALTIYDEYKPERVYQRTGKRAVARLVHKGVTIAIKHANDTGYISRIMREGYGLKY